MKSLFKMSLIPLCLMNANLSKAAAPETSTVSKTCDGVATLIKEDKPVRENFFINIYQQAYVQDALILSETHTFTLPGFLGSPDSYTARKKTSGDHIIYEGPKFLLAIPWRKDASVEFLDLSDKSIPGPQFSASANLRWQVLCKAKESSPDQTTKDKIEK